MINLVKGFLEVYEDMVEVLLVHKPCTHTHTHTHIHKFCELCFHTYEVKVLKALSVKCDISF